MELIFEEFAQIENPLQRRVKGTGLGLPLCRKLAELLGGTVRSKASSARARYSPRRFRCAMPASMASWTISPAAPSRNSTPCAPRC